MTKVRGYDPVFLKNKGPDREAVRQGSDALRGAMQTAQKNLDQAQTKLGAAQKKVFELSGKALTLNIEITKLGAKAPKELKDQLKATQAELATAMTETQAAAQNVGLLKKQLEGFQNIVLAHESATDAQLAVNGRMKEFDVSSVDVTDAGSLTRDEQVRILGRPVDVSKDQATSSDRRRVSIAVASRPENGAAMLALQLKNSPPEVQAQLLQKLADPKRNHLDFLAQQAGQSKAVAGALLEAASNASGPAKEQILKALVKHGGANAVAALKDQLKKGDRFDVVAPLMRELKAAGKTSELTELVGAAAGKLKELRGKFESTKKVTDELNGDLARLVVGFGNSLDKDAIAKGVEAFKDRHTKEYGAFKNASAEYASALTMLDSMDVVPKTDKAMTMRVRGAAGNPMYQGLASAEDKALVGFHDEIASLEKANLKAVTDTPEGQEALQRAFQRQSSGVPNWIDSLKSYHGNAKDTYGTLTKTLPTIVSQGLGRMALRGSSTKELTDFLFNNRKLLGLSDEGFKRFDAMARHLADPKLSPGLRNQALDELKTGDFPPSVKLIGVALALPDAISSIANFKDASTLDKLSTIVKTTELGNDVASLMMQETKFMKGLGKAMGVAGAALDIASGISKLFEGQPVNGSSDIVSGVGAGIMMVPGGQLVGAALIVGSMIAKHLWGEDPAADAEKADEKDARAFLEGAGLKADTAAALSNVKQSDRRNIGTFVDQAAAHLGMDPKALMKKLDGLSKSKLEAFTRMVLEMPADKSWKYATKKPEFDPLNADNAKQMRTPYGNYGPKSMPTAIEWMKNNGVI
jgi:hypothetical protein